MAVPLNPYVAGNPVGDSAAFVGRTAVLRVPSGSVRCCYCQVDMVQPTKQV